MNIKKIVTQSMLFPLMALAASACHAEVQQCDYPESLVSTKDRYMAEGVLDSHWVSSIDPVSHEYKKTLYIIYKDGNLAVVEHKYCTMYNVEISLLSRDNASQQTRLKNMTATIDRLFSSTVKIDGTFTKPLKDIIATAIVERFDVDKYLSLGLPSDQVDIDDGVEYSITYSPYENIGTNFSHIVNFYFAVGGE